MVERTERPRDEGVYSSRIERDKKEKGKYSKGPPDKEKQLLLATFFSYLKKMFDNFSPSKKLAGKVVDQHVIIEHLEKFKKILEKLSQKDLSNSADYAIELSDIWANLIEDFDTIEILERKNLQDVATFREMMDLIKNYPPDSEHHFGYYLLQHAGKDWLPFPFMEMLETLHKEHITTPETSSLTEWLKLIDKVIANLKKHISFKLP